MLQLVLAASAEALPHNDTPVSGMSISWEPFGTSSASAGKCDAAACACSISWEALQHNDIPVSSMSISWEPFWS